MRNPHPRRSTARPACSRVPPGYEECFGLHERSGRSDTSGAIPVLDAGTIRYICTAQLRLTAALIPGVIGENDSAYIEGSEHRHLRAAPSVPALRSRLSVSTASGVEFWHLIQVTEAYTLDGRVSITAARTSNSNGDCAIRWIAKVRISGHVGRWAPPRDWL